MELTQASIKAFRSEIPRLSDAQATTVQQALVAVQDLTPIIHALTPSMQEAQQTVMELFTIQTTQAFSDAQFADFISSIMIGGMKNLLDWLNGQHSVEEIEPLADSLPYGLTARQFCTLGAVMNAFTNDYLHSQTYAEYVAQQSGQQG